MSNGSGGSGQAVTPDAERTKQLFLSHMRHELRTPVNAIIGYSEMLLEDLPAEAPSRGDLERILAAGRTLLALISDLLDPSRVGEIDGANISAFGAKVRHQLRTPVNTVIGYTEMLIEDQTLGEVAGADLQRILTSGQRLLALMDDIIDVSKVLSGRGELQLDHSHVSSLVRDVVSVIRPLSEADLHRADEQGGRILVVDDNDVNRDMLSRRLEREGFDPVMAEDGIKALEKLKQGPFDLVLLDILMPGLNGYQVLEQIKTDPELRHLPVIMISALDEIDSVVRCIEIGAEDYLPKPFNPIILRARIGACLEKKRLRDREVLHLRQIEEEKHKSDELLHVILPHEIVEELKATNAVRPRRHENVAVLFCDIVSFTPFCASREPDEIVSLLQGLIVAYEEIAARYEVLKIKTIGDSFMGSCGLLSPIANPGLNAVRCGLEMLEAAHATPAHWDVRVGIHVGPVTAGVVGHRTYLFDLWGDTVNTAARVESHGKNGAVNLSAETWAQVKDYCQGESLGRIKVKGKGEMEIFRVLGLRD